MEILEVAKSLFVDEKKKKIIMIILSMKNKKKELSEFNIYKKQKIPIISWIILAKI